MHMAVLLWDILTAGIVWSFCAILVAFLTTFIFLLQYDCPTRWEGIVVVRVELIRSEIEARKNWGNGEGLPIG